MSARTKKSLVILISIPAAIIGLLLLLARIMEPGVVSFAGNTANPETSYINPDKFYIAKGGIEIVPGEHVDYADMHNFTGDMRPQDALTKIYEKYPHFSADNLSDVYSPECLWNKDYIATACMLLKLPASVEYSMIFPGDFSAYIIYVNGRKIYEYDKLSDGTYLNPAPRLIKLPYNSFGRYEIIVTVNSPKGYGVSGFDTILIGTDEKIASAYNLYRDLNLLTLCFIVVTLVFIAMQFVAFKGGKKLTAFCLYFLAAFLYVFTKDEFSLITTGLSVPLPLMLLLKSVATPIYTSSILFICYALFPEVFPKKLVHTIVFLQIFPIISELSFRSFDILTYISDLVLILPLVPCLYVFLLSFEASKPYSLRFGICIFFVEADILMRHTTYNLAVPLMFDYFPPIGAFMVLNVLMMADKYKTQNVTESYYKDELNKYLGALQASENAFLNAQIKPHFLYNTLNTIADLCVTDPEKAKGLIDSLTEYLKLILELDNMEEQVSLKRELELANAYTAIEKERFPSINFYRDYPIKMPDISLPALTIQPLIENAIKHGVRKSNRPGAVTLRIVDAPDKVTFFVSDNGVGMNEETIRGLFNEPKENKSIGIYNIDKRLKNQYNEGLSIDSTIDLGTCVTFTIPKK